MTVGYHSPALRAYRIGKRALFLPMNMPVSPQPPVSPRLLHLFHRVLRARHWLVGAFLVAAGAGIYGALRIPTDSAIERLVIAGDPVAQATLEFERVFPQGDQALLMLEAPEPFGLARAASYRAPRTRTQPHTPRRGTQPADALPAQPLERANRSPGCRGHTEFRDRHVAVSPRRTGGRTLSRHRARAARELRGRARPRVGGHRRAGAAAGRLPAHRSPPFAAWARRGSTPGSNVKRARPRGPPCRCSAFS